MAKSGWGEKNQGTILLIAHGQGFLVIPEKHVPEFKKKLVTFYEGEEPSVISGFLKKNCWKTF